MTLTTEQIELVGSLVHHPGYLLLMDLIQAEVDDLTDDLARADDARKAVAKLFYWRVFRQIAQQLRAAPTDFLRSAEQTKRDGELAQAVGETLLGAY